MKPLYKTTIVIWTAYDPTPYELAYLADQATEGDAYCSVQRWTKVKDPEGDPDWDGTDFFSGVEVNLAAAPEMLDVLRRVEILLKLDIVRDDGETLAKVQAAIEKATGGDVK